MSKFCHALGTNVTEIEAALWRFYYLFIFKRQTDRIFSVSCMYIEFMLGVDITVTVR